MGGEDAFEREADDPGHVAALSEVCEMGGEALARIGPTRSGRRSGASTDECLIGAVQQGPGGLETVIGVLHASPIVGFTLLATA